MFELWKPIPSIPHYESSSCGNIRHIKIKRNRKLIYDRDGYLRFCARINGKNITSFVHRCIFEAFYNWLPEQINHKNGIKDDNSIINLEASTPAHNRKHAADNKLTAYGSKNGSAKLTEKQVKRIKTEYKYYSRIHGSRSLAKKYKVSCRTIRNIVNGSN